MTVLIVIAIVVVLILLWIMGSYNGLIRSRNKVKDQWAQVDVLLKRRADLIPNLVSTVKGYTSHEESTLQGVIEARNKFVASPTKEAEMEASGELTNALNRLFALTEAYPDLKANDQFLKLQTELSETENQISYGRQFYNDAVLRYQNKKEVFPTNIVASMFHFQDEKFFEAKEVEKEVPKVEF